MEHKVFIEVIAKFDLEGKIIPLSLIWEDGRIFEIDKILDITRAASLKAGGIGIRYTCRVRNKTIKLFCDDNIWFIEKG